MISMMEAYHIEALKKEGYTYEQIVKAFDESADEKVLVLKTIHERDREEFQQAYIGHYKISFVTINGLRNLLNLRYDLPRESYRTEQNGIFDVQLSEEIENEVRHFISSNWTIERHGDYVSIFVEGKGQ